MVWYGHVIKQYEVPLSWKLNYIQKVGLIQWHKPSNGQTLRNFVALIQNVDFYRITRGFHKSFGTDMTCQQGSLTHSTAGPVSFWTRVVLFVETLLTRTCDFIDFTFRLFLATFSILLIAMMEHFNNIPVGEYMHAFRVFAFKKHLHRSFVI